MYNEYSILKISKKQMKEELIDLARQAWNYYLADGEENIEKLKIIIYALKRIFTSNRKNLIFKVTREELLFIYDKCIEKQLEYENTEDEINNFLDYYYVSLIKSL